MKAGSLVEHKNQKAMENSKESNQLTSGFFKVKYRIIPVYKKYQQIAVLVQKKHWWFPVWFDVWNNVVTGPDNCEVERSTSAIFTTKEEALKFIEARKTVY